MRYLAIAVTMSLFFLNCMPVLAQDEGERRIVIHPESYFPVPPPYEEPIPLDQTLKLEFKLEGPDVEKTVTLLAATTVYGAQVKESEEDGLMIGGTLRMVRNTEVLVTFNFEARNGKLGITGDGSVKIRLGESKIIFKYKDYTISVHVTLDSN